MSESGIFKAAVKLPPERRAAYLDQACGSDAELRREIESLLHAHDATGGFLRSTGGPGPDRRLPADRRAPRHGHRSLQTHGADRRGRLRPGLRRRAATPHPPQGGPEDHQARHGLARGHRPVRGRAAGPGADGPRRTSPGSSMPARPTAAGPTSSWSWLRAAHRRLLRFDSSPTRDRLELFLSVCQAVQHAHRRGSFIATSSPPTSWSPLTTACPWSR